MPNINRVILAGHLTRDPELTTVNSNKPISLCKCGIAVNRFWRDEQGNKQEQVCFVDFAAWAKAGEALKKWARVGDAVLIEGRLEMNEWTDKASQKKRISHTIVAESVHFLTPKEKEGK
jgi:single-strand DNA-binding protein